MYRLKLVILIIFVFSIELNAQDARYCVGTSHDFGVPPTLGSIYNWQIQNSTIASISSGNGTEQILIDLNNTGLFQLMVEEVDANGCIGYDSVLVEIIPLPTPNIFALGPIAFCEGERVFLQVDSIYPTMIWMTNGDTISTFPEIMVDTTGEYFIDVTDTNGCVGRSPSINTLQHPNPDVDFSLDGVCENIPSFFNDISVIPDDSITERIWHLGDGSLDFGDSIMHIYDLEGDYDVKLIVFSDFGCLDSLTKTITIFNQPTANFTFSPYTISTLQPEVNFVNTTFNAIPMLWDFDDSTTSVMENPNHIFEDPGLYDVKLTVIDINQCIDSISKQIIMYYDFVLYMPNSFTPNGDTHNPKFGPTGMRMEKYFSYHFIIYNQWGEKVFEAYDINDWWDGNNAIDGVYSWIIIIEDEVGKIRKEAGSVTLIK